MYGCMGVWVYGCMGGEVGGGMWCDVIVKERGLGLSLGLGLSEIEDVNRAITSDYKHQSASPKRKYGHDVEHMYVFLGGLRGVV